MIVVKAAVLVCVCAVITILPELVRNIVTFHSISSSETSSQFLVGSWDVRYLISNLLQNVGFNLTHSFFDMSELIGKLIFKPIYILYTGTEIPDILLGFDLLQANDLNHDCAVNPIITWLMIIAVGGSCIRWFFNRNKKDKEEAIYGYVWVSVIAFIIFCTFVRWYKFVTRYEVGYFVLLAPAIMLLFQYIFNKKKEVTYVFAGIIGFVCIVSMVQLVDYHKKYIIINPEERVEQYFKVRWLYPQYSEIVNQIESQEYQQVGFICGIDSYEYPFFQMLKGDIERFEHVCVTNETSKYKDEGFIPECIIAVDVEMEAIIEFNNNTYKLVNDVSGVRLFVNSNSL